MEELTKKEKLLLFLESGNYNFLYENNAPPKINRIPVVAPEKIGRNEECPCGSGKKYKKCCGKT
jgi:uncharacterized protein YecA (UPF0149 family)